MDSLKSICLSAFCWLVAVTLSVVGLACAVVALRNTFPLGQWGPLLGLAGLYLEALSLFGGGLAMAGMYRTLRSPLTKATVEWPFNDSLLRLVLVHQIPATVLLAGWLG